MEGKVAQVAATECGKGWSFNPRRFSCVPDPVLWVASDPDALQLLVTVQLVESPHPYGQVASVAISGIDAILLDV
jgi:hypothetical protein